MDIREINGQRVQFIELANHDGKLCVGCPWYVPTTGREQCACDHGDEGLLCKGGVFRPPTLRYAAPDAPDATAVRLHAQALRTLSPRDFRGHLYPPAFEPTETQTFGPLAAATTLPTDSAARKDIPIYSGVVAYFPAALAGMARISKQGNDKHNAGQPLHHTRGKSADHADCIMRHLIDLGDRLAAIERTPAGQQLMAAEALDEASNLAWRALAYSQELHERLGAAPLAPGAKV